VERTVERASLTSLERAQSSSELSRGFKADPPNYQTEYAKTCSNLPRRQGPPPEADLNIRGVERKNRLNPEKILV
jgi:hypothetical protein